MSKMLGKLKENSIERDLELQQQKEEVSRLKAELEALKEAKAKEISDISSSYSKEIKQAKKSYEERCPKEVAENNRRANESHEKEKEISSNLERSNKILTEESGLLKEKFEAWRNLADMLNHDMEGNNQLLCRLKCLCFYFPSQSDIDLSPDLLRAVTNAFLESHDLAVKAVLESRKDRPANEEPYWSM